MESSDIKRRLLSDTVLESLEPENKSYRKLDGKVKRTVTSRGKANIRNHVVSGHS